jgi:hypothetical protein
VDLPNAKFARLLPDGEAWLSAKKVQVMKLALNEGGA